MTKEEIVLLGVIITVNGFWVLATILSTIKNRNIINNVTKAFGGFILFESIVASFFYCTYLVSCFLASIWGVKL